MKGCQYLFRGKCTAIGVTTLCERVLAVECYALKEFFYAEDETTVALDKAVAVIGEKNKKIKELQTQIIEYEAKAIQGEERGEKR